MHCACGVPYMLITDYLRPVNVIFESRPHDKMSVLRAMTDHMAANGDITDAGACLEALLERERLMTTGVGKGVALPHAFSGSAPDTAISYLRAAEGVDFESVDEKPVRHIFCILGPPSAQGRHLKILARLARLLNQEQFLQALDEAQTPEDILAVCRKHEDALQPR